MDAVLMVEGWHCVNFELNICFQISFLPLSTNRPDRPGDMYEAGQVILVFEEEGYQVDNSRLEQLKTWGLPSELPSMGSISRLKLSFQFLMIILTESPGTQRCRRCEHRRGRVPACLRGSRDSTHHQLGIIDEEEEREGKERGNLLVIPRTSWQPYLMLLPFLSPPESPWCVP